MTLPTKYADKILLAQQLVAKYGSNTCVWIQAPPAINDPTNMTPEFPVTPDPIEYLIDIVFFPLSRLNQLTTSFNIVDNIPSANYAGIMAGGQEFTPQYGDTVRFPDNSEHQVVYLNTTLPDVTAVVYEVYLT